MSRIAAATTQIKTLLTFMAPMQVSHLGSALRCAERDYFFGKIAELANTFNTMPKTYEQDGKGEDAIVYLHYFRGGMDWYITEKDMEAEQYQAFGYADIGYGLSGGGYISLIELAENNIELDIHWTPKTIGEVKASRN